MKIKLHSFSRPGRVPADTRKATGAARSSSGGVWMAAVMLVALAMVAAPARAQRHGDDWYSDPQLYGSLVEVQVLVDGHRAPFYVAPGQWDRHYFEAFRGRKAHIDLRAAIVHQVSRLGIPAASIDTTDLCTYRDADLFFSHRRENGLTGRLAAFVGCRTA